MTDVDKDTQIVSLTADLERVKRVVVDREIKAAITAERGSHGLLAPHVRPFVRMRRNADGQPVAVVVDEHGNARLRPGSQDLMTVRDLVKVLREDKDFHGAFEGSGSSGSGSDRGLAEHQPTRSDRARIL